MATGVSAMHVQVVKTVKSLEQARIAPLLRQGIPRRRLRLEGRMGVDEEPCKGAVARKNGLSAEYAGKLLRALADDGLLAWIAETRRYTVTEAGDKALVSSFRHRGFTRSSVKTIVRKLSH